MLGQDRFAFDWRDGFDDVRAIRADSKRCVVQIRRLVLEMHDHLPGVGRGIDYPLLVCDSLIKIVASSACPRPNIGDDSRREGR